MVFCSPFDAALARSGPPAVFLWDRYGELRFDPEWTRDVWERSPGPHAPGDRYALVRDRDTGYVQLLLVTSPTLLVDHPRAQIRLFEALGDAEAALRAIGRPPVEAHPW